MFSPANVKIAALSKSKLLKPYNKGKVYSLDLLSGWSCPFAHDCLSKVHKVGGKSKLVDGPDTQFRCFSASAEVIFPAVYNKRNANYQALRGLTRVEMVELIRPNIPKDAGIIRLSVGGDFFNQAYFDAILYLAQTTPDILFYGYTKSLPYWVKRLAAIPNNLVLTASYGGRCDHLIKEYRLRSAIVVMHPSDTTLEIDHTDEHAAAPSLRHNDFSLLLHGVQKGESIASAAIRRLKQEGVKYSYAR